VVGYGGFEELDGGDCGGIFAGGGSDGAAFWEYDGDEFVGVEFDDGDGAGCGAVGIGGWALCDDGDTDIVFAVGGD